MSEGNTSILSIAQQVRSAGLRVLLPSDDEFATRQRSIWSLSAQILPGCIVRPHTTQEVAIAVHMFSTHEWEFAIRSGGHTPWAGASSVAGGIILDLSLLASIQYDYIDSAVIVGPGALWKDVYAKLDQVGRMVAGGREGNVGVGGLILGGGYSFLTARKGFACDTVIQFEVVLADGSIILADAQQSSDLFWALKGGSNNFGVVTSFKMETYEGTRIWGGVTFYPKSISYQAIKNLTAFTEDLPNALDSSMLCFFAHTDVVVAMVALQADGEPSSFNLQPWRELPSIFSTCRPTTMSEYVSTPEHSMPGGYHNIFFTATFKNSVRIAVYAVELHEKLVSEFKERIPDGDFWTQCLLQPLPTMYAARSVAAGGNAMGLERQSVNGLLFVAVAMVRTSSQYTWAYLKVKTWLEAVKAFAGTETEGGNLDWIYLNYADMSQNPLRSYGVDNLRRMEEVAVKYDPEQVFQRLCPGGFKISSAK
ncbi:hypothetical protein F5Y10DRAFT_275322 [Nemania abortiva]|nr:hypothetical protein F5Y10DRAFT_275322 [Nemania abortiva]